MSSFLDYLFVHAFGICRLHTPNFDSRVLSVVERPWGGPPFFSSRTLGLFDSLYFAPPPPPPSKNLLI